MQRNDNHLRRMSKRFTTELYADQLAPLYPHLKLSQIKGALVFTENNMHECRLFLDMKKRFLNSCQENLESKLGCNSTASHNQRENEDKFSSCGTSTLTLKASTSSAYNADISESVSDITKPQEKPEDQKVGVIIIRNNQGYKASPL